MSSLQISIILFTLLVITLNYEFVSSYERNYPGAIELVGFNNNRRARMKQDFNNAAAMDNAPPMKKMRADIETVKQNIDEYNKLFKVDTKKLTEQQKDMLERIVERVARLKETFDINDIDNSSNSSDLINDDDNDDNGYSTDEAEPSTTSIPTTTLISDTSSSELFQDMEQISSETEARSSHVNIDAQTTNSDSGSTISINSGTTSTLNRVNIPTKPKNRHNTTKRPLSSARATTKRTTSVYSLRPTASVTSSISSLSSPSSLATAAATSGSYGTNSGQKIAAITTIQPQIKQQLQKQQQQQLLYKQQQQLQLQLQQQQLQLHLQQQQQQKEHTNVGGTNVSIKQQQQQITQDQDPIEQKTMPSNDHHEILPPRSPIGVSGGPLTADLLYNSNVTTSSIIDSLNADAREDYYNSGGVVINDSFAANNNKSNNKEKVKWRFIIICFI